MADPQSFSLSSEHPLSLVTTSRDEMISVLEYLQPTAGSGLSAVIAAWVDPTPGVVAKTGVNTSQAIGYETLRQNLENNTAYQTLTGAGNVLNNCHVTYLSAASGNYALTMDVGVDDGQEKIIILANPVTTAVFTLTAGFLDYNTITFAQGSRCAVLRWVGGSIQLWTLVGGNAQGA